MSHPTWVRGLKQLRQANNRARWQVAPYVGAWIETKYSFMLLKSYCVAPYVGAWIETSEEKANYHLLYRRTLRGCVD